MTPWHEPFNELHHEVEEIERRLDTQIDSRLSAIDRLLHRLQLQLFWRWILALIGIALITWGLFHVANTASNVAHAVATQRATSILSNCQDQNRRHDNTIRYLHRIVVQQEHNPNLTAKQKAQLPTVEAQNDLLINALAPKQNCQQVLQKNAPPSTRNG